MKSTVVKAAITAIVCLCLLVYCSWALRRANQSFFPPDVHYKVEVTVTGPDGKVIPAVAPAPR